MRNSRRAPRPLAARRRRRAGPARPGPFPRAFPFFPRPWSISRAEAVDIALERFRDLGEPVKDPYSSPRLGPRLRPRAPPAGRSRRGGGRGSGVRRSGAAAAGRRLGGRRLSAGSAATIEWAYLAEISLSGRGPGGSPAPRSRRRRRRPSRRQAARARADAFLARQGIDLSRYEPPEIRSQQLAGRTDLTVRYRDRRDPLAGRESPTASRCSSPATASPASAAGSTIRGRRRSRARSPGVNFLNVGRILWIFLSAGVLAFPFLKRYHAGEIGVRRGVQIFLLVAGARGLAMLLLGGARELRGRELRLRHPRAEHLAGDAVRDGLLHRPGRAALLLRLVGRRVGLPRALGAEAGGLRRPLPGEAGPTAPWRARPSAAGWRGWRSPAAWRRCCWPSRGWEGGRSPRCCAPTAAGAGARDRPGGPRLALPFCLAVLLWAAAGRGPAPGEVGGLAGRRPGGCRVSAADGADARRWAGPSPSPSPSRRRAGAPLPGRPT